MSYITVDKTLLSDNVMTLFLLMYLSISSVFYAVLGNTLLIQRLIPPGLWMEETRQWMEKTGQ